MSDAMDSKDPRNYLDDEEETSHKDDESMSFGRGKESGRTGSTRNVSSSGKSGAGSRAPKSAGKGGKNLVPMAPVKFEPEKKELAKPKKARSAYNFFLEKRIAQLREEGEIERHRDRFSQAAGEWRGMTFGERVPFEDMARADKDRHQKDVDIAAARNLNAASSSVQKHGQGMCSAIGFPGLKALDPDSPHDDVCIVCKEESDLLCCDFCRVTHHLTCLEPPMTTLPSDDVQWACPACSAKVDIAEIAAPQQKSRRERKEGKKRQRASTSSGTGSPRDSGDVASTTSSVAKRRRESREQNGPAEGSDGQKSPTEKCKEEDKRALDTTLSESIGSRGSSDSASIIKVPKQANIPQRVGLGLTDTPPEASAPLYSEEDGSYAHNKSSSKSMMSLAAAAASVAASEAAAAAAAAAAASGFASATASPALTKNSVPPKMLGLKKMLNQRAQSDEASFNSSPPFSAKKLLKHRVLAAQSLHEPTVVAPLSPKMEGVEGPGNSQGGKSRDRTQNAEWYSSDGARTDGGAPGGGHFEPLENISTEEPPGHGGSSYTATQGVARWDGGFTERETFNAVAGTVEGKVDCNGRQGAEEENLNSQQEADAKDREEGRNQQRVGADAESDGTLLDSQGRTPNNKHRVESHVDSHPGDVGPYSSDPRGVEGSAGKWPSGRRNLPRHDACNPSGSSAYSPQQKLGQHSQQQYPRGTEQYDNDYRRGRNKFHYGVRGPEETDRSWMDATYAQGPRPSYRQQYESSRGPAPIHRGGGASRGPPQAYDDAVLPKPLRWEDRDWKPDRPVPINREEGFRGREVGRGAEEDYNRHGRRGRAEFYSSGGGAAIAIDARSSRPDLLMRRETGGNGQWGPGHQNPETDRGWSQQGPSRSSSPKHFGSKVSEMWTDELRASERGPGVFVSDRRSHSARPGIQHLDVSRLGLDGMRNSRFGDDPTRASSGGVVDDEDYGYYGWGRRKQSLDAYNGEDGSFAGPKKSTPWKAEASGSVGGGFQGGRHDSREFRREAASTMREGRSSDAQYHWPTVRARNDGRRSGFDSPNRRNDKGSWFSALKEPTDEVHPAKVRSSGRGPERGRIKDWGASRPPDSTARSDAGGPGYTRRDGSGAHRGRGGHRGVWKARVGGRSGFHHHGENSKAPFTDWRAAQTQAHAEKRQLSRQREGPSLGGGRTPAWSGKVADRDRALSDRGIGPPNVEDVSERSSRSSGRRGRPDESISNGAGSGSDSGSRRGIHGDRRREGSGSAHSARRNSAGQLMSKDARNGLDKGSKEPSFHVGQAAITGGREVRAFPRTNRAGGGEYPKFSAIKPGMTGYSGSTSTTTSGGHTTRAVPVTTEPLSRSDLAWSHDRELDQQRSSARSAALNTADWAGQGDGRTGRSRSPLQRTARRKTPPNSRRADAGGDGHTNRGGESYDAFQRQGKPRGAWEAQGTQGVGVGRGTDLGGPKPWRDEVESTVRNSDGRDGEKFGGRTPSHVRSPVGHRGNFPGKPEFGGSGRGAAAGRWHLGK